MIYRYKCESKQRLKFHINGVHEGVKYDCATCKSSFTHKSKMKQHIKTVHEKIKPFACDICDKSFGYKNNLKRHTVEKHDQKNLELLSPTLLKHKKEEIERQEKLINYYTVINNEMGFETCKFCNRVIYYRILTTNPL